VTEVKLFHETLVFTDLVVDKDWAMQKLAYAPPFSDGAANARKTRQQFHMVKQRIAKPRSCFIVVLGNVTDDFGEVV
jgi:hypothetical protein